MKTLLFLFFLTFSVGTFAQTRLEGKVTDANTGEPIVFATVVLYQNGVLKMGTETDFDGYYAITELAFGEYEIEVATTGYKPAKFAKAKIEKQAVYKFDVKMTPEYLPKGLICEFEPPLIKLEDTTQGHIFKKEDVRHSPARN